MQKTLKNHKGYVEKYCDSCKRRFLSGVAVEIAKEFPDKCRACR